MEMKLFYLGNVTDMSEEQNKEVETFITGFEYGIIATNHPENGPRLSALNNLTGQSPKQLHFATDATSQKVKNIQLDSRCEFMYANMNSGQVMLSGKAEIVTDLETKKALWQEWMNEYSPEGPEGDGICIIRFVPETIRAMISC